MFSFGVSNHSPEQALHFLVRRSIVADTSAVAIVPAGTLLATDKKPSRKIIFILSISDFNRNLKTLNSASYQHTQVFLFASPLRVAELSNTTALDFEPHPANQGLGWLLKKEFNLAALKARLRQPVLEVSRQSTKYLTLLTDTAKQGSLLNPLMTFIYTLPSSTHQTPVKEAVVDYLYKGSSFEALESLLDSIKGIIVSDRIRDRLKAILQAEEGLNIRKAFKEYRAAKKIGKVIPWPTLARNHGVADYELRYLKSVFDAKLQSKPGRGKLLGTVLTKKAA